MLTADLTDYLRSRATYEGGRFLASDVARLAKVERDAIDQHLVSIKHPMAYEPGTQNQRIEQFARELANV